MSATFVMVWAAFSKLIAGIGRFYPGGPILPLSTKISKGRLTYMSRLDLGLINMGLAYCLHQGTKSTVICCDCERVSMATIKPAESKMTEVAITKWNILLLGNL